MTSYFFPIYTEKKQNINIFNSSILNSNTVFKKTIFGIEKRQKTTNEILDSNNYLSLEEKFSWEKYLQRIPLEEKNTSSKLNKLKKNFLVYHLVKHTQEAIFKFYRNKYIVSKINHHYSNTNSNTNSNISRKINNSNISRKINNSNRFFLENIILIGIKYKSYLKKMNYDVIFHKAFEIIKIEYESRREDITKIINSSKEVRRPLCKKLVDQIVSLIEHAEDTHENRLLLDKYRSQRLYLINESLFF
jgi:hypothetical protein